MGKFSGVKDFQITVCCSCVYIVNPGVFAATQVACTSSRGCLGTPSLQVCRHCCQTVGCQMSGSAQVILILLSDLGV